MMIVIHTGTANPCPPDFMNTLYIPDCIFGADHAALIRDCVEDRKKIGYEVESCAVICMKCRAELPLSLVVLAVG
jgi:hypothetical protein